MITCRRQLDHSLDWITTISSLSNLPMLTKMEVEFHISLLRGFPVCCLKWIIILPPMAETCSAYNQDGIKLPYPGMKGYNLKITFLPCPKFFSSLICSTNFLHDIDQHEMDCSVNLLIWAFARLKRFTSRIVCIMPVKKFTLLVLEF